MTVKAMSAAFELGRLYDLPSVSRLILLALGDRADDSGYAFPGLAELESKVGVDARTIQRHFVMLESAGLLVRYYRTGGRSVPSLYRIIADSLTDDPDAPGFLRYWSLFGGRIKGDNMSPIFREKVTRWVGKGDTRGRKGRHSSVTRSDSIPKEPKDDFIIQEPTIPRLPGESHKDYMLRVASLIPGLDK